MDKLIKFVFKMRYKNAKLNILKYNMHLRVQKDPIVQLFLSKSEVIPDMTSAPHPEKHFQQLRIFFTFLKIILMIFLGPDLPLYNPDDCDNNGNFTCETSLQNIVDVYYFDVQDTFSCKDQVSFLILL